MTCCEKLRINGVLTHETGCTNKWVDEIRKCKFCDADFKPETWFQKCCDHSCEVAYNGDTCDCTKCLLAFLNLI